MADIDKTGLGKPITIRGVAHIPIAASDDTLLFLQMDENGDPCQYVVAHGVYPHKGEICWLNGDYFLLPLNAHSITALKQAVEVMTDALP